MTGRAPLFDRARTGLVLGVVALHAACGYSGLAPWWHVRGTPSAAADLTVAVLDVFLMPPLFCIAGVFAPASAARTTAAGFVAAKARRLLAPLVLLTLFYLPPMAWRGLREGGDAAGFLDFWRRSLAGLADWRPALLDTLEKGQAARGDLSPHLLWFLGLLFLFFMAYRFLPGLRELATRLGAHPARWLGACLAMALAATAVNALVPAGAWWRWGPFLLFQPVRLPLYAGFFLLGAGLGGRGDGPPAPPRGRAWPYLAAGGVAVAATVVLAGPVHGPGPVPFAAMALHAACRTAANAFLILGGLRLMRLRRPLGPLGAALSAASYDTYLLHMPLVVFAEYALAGLAWPGPAKAALAALAVVAVCLAASAGLTRPHPRAALAALGLWFAGFCLSGG